MAEQLIDSLTRRLRPDAYRDEYREELLAMIERKAAGEEVVAAPEEEREPTKAPDLMAALEQSIAAVQGKREARSRRRRRRRQRRNASTGKAAPSKPPARRTRARAKAEVLASSRSGDEPAGRGRRA